MMNNLNNPNVEQLSSNVSTRERIAIIGGGNW